MLNKGEISDQAAGLRRLAQASPVQVIAVTAGKGGVGKTNVSVNLAYSLAKKHSVLLLDADLGLANVDVMLGLHAEVNLSQVIEGRSKLQDIILHGPGNMQIIPASSGTEKMVNLSPIEHAGIISAFSELTNDVNYLIIDTAAGISDTVLTFTRAAQEVVVVVCDEPTSLTDAYALIKVMSRFHQCQHFHVLANMVDSQKEGRDLFAKLCQVTEKFLDVTLNYLGAVSQDNMVKTAVKKQRAVCDAYPSAKAAREFAKIAEKIEQWPVSSEIKGGQGFFLERLIHCHKE